MGELEGITDSSNIYIHSGERLVLQYANRGGGDQSALWHRDEFEYLR